MFEIVQIKVKLIKSLLNVNKLLISFLHVEIKKNVE